MNESEDVQNNVQIEEEKIDQQQVDKKEKQIISMEKLYEMWVHVGHRKNRWHPKMKTYISGEKNNVHIINLNRTIQSLELAYKVIKELTEKNGKVLFVGTKQNDKKIISANAIRANTFYVNHRWLGGTLTNFSTVSKSIERYKALERLEKTGFDGYTKKEGLLLAKELYKLDRVLKGIKLMRNKPNLIFLTNPKIDHLAVLEAKKLGIPIIGICDTNIDPSLIDLPIPANDDLIQSVGIITTIIADAICESKGQERYAAYQQDNKVAIWGVIPQKAIDASELVASIKAKIAKAKMDNKASFKGKGYTRDNRNDWRNQKGKFNRNENSNFSKTNPSFKPNRDQNQPKNEDNSKQVNNLPKQEIKKETKENSQINERIKQTV